MLCLRAMFLTFTFIRFATFSSGLIGKLFLAGIFVPLIEEIFFRGIVLGLLLRTGRKIRSLPLLRTFRRGPLFKWAGPSFDDCDLDFWLSGHRRFVLPDSATYHSASAFATLFLIGWILADARVRLRARFGYLLDFMRAGFWIAARSAVARRQIDIFPWLGQNWLVGIVPIGIGALTWLLMIFWLKYGRTRKA